MAQHLDRNFDIALESVKSDILKMGDIVEFMLGDTLKALMERNLNVIERIKENEVIVNKMQIEIDELCLKIIALHQPTAIDLRFLMGVTKINTALERIGDHAINICNCINRILQYKQMKPYVDLPELFKIAREMFMESLNAFINLNTENARSILLRDDQVDSLRDKIVQECINYMIKDSSNVNIAVNIILLANNLEKIADHATNISEIVIFVAQGKDVRHQSE